MKSGLEGRNNLPADRGARWGATSLNEVRPRRPEQSAGTATVKAAAPCLNEVRPRRPEQSEVGNMDAIAYDVSMKSGLEGRNNHDDENGIIHFAMMSQ